MNKKDSRDIFDRAGTWLAFALLFATFFGALAVAAYQIYVWLRFGDWQAMPFHILFAWLHADLDFIGNMDWQGIKKIIVWILELPLSLVLIIIAGVALTYWLDDAQKAR